jgi:RHS repeat-associated protein
MALVRLFRLAVALLCLPWFGSSLQAQNAEFTQNTKGSNAMTMQVPLANYPGRGISLPVTLHYSTQGLWRIGFLNSTYENVSGYQVLQPNAEAVYAEHSTAGWKTSLDIPEVEWPKQNDRYWYTGKPYAIGYVAGFTFRIARVFIHMPDGSTHELRKADAVYQDNNSIDMTGTFYAVDGSRMRYDSTGEQTGTLYLGDGSRYILNGSTIQFIDRNGNTLNFNAANRQWTDTMGRVIGMPWPANPGAGDYTYSLPGIGTASITYTLKFRNLSDVLLPDVAGQSLKPISNYYLPTPGAMPGSGNLPHGPLSGGTMFWSSYADPDDESNAHDFTYVVGRGQSGNVNFNPVVLSEIDLPNGQNYRFFYNAYGELDKVIYPAGGYERCQYGTVTAIGADTQPYIQGTRGMLSRWVSPSGSGSDEAQWTYSASTSPLTVTAPDASGAPNGTRTEFYIHNAASSQLNNFGYTDASNGLPGEDRVYAPQSQGGAMLRRTLIDYAQSSVTYNKPVPPNTFNTGTYTAYRNARSTKTVSLILDTGGNALASTATMGYDTTYDFTVGSDATTSSQYDFASVDQTTAQTGAINSIPTGSLVRSTQTTNLTGDANYRNRNILGSPSSATIYDAASNVVAQSNISYDESSYPLLTYGSVTSWTDPGTNVRGNPTSHASWLNTTNSWLATHAQYDQCGSARNAWDAKGNESQVEYLSTYAYAYPTTARTTVPDPSGQYGSSTAFVSTSVFDFNTGLATSATDANGFISIPEYNDPLLRPTRAVHASGNAAQTQSLMEYDDANRTVTGKSDLTNFNDSILKAKTLTDAMGRTIEARTYESDTNYIAVQTQYDSMGRAYKVSNPFRPGETIYWTTTAFDALGRVASATTPDGAVVTTVYLGNTVTVTDQAGRKRRTVSDALGRVIRVDEPDKNNGNLDDQNGVPVQSTSYVYDALDNLRQVNQGSQTRTFVYDSLKRLTSATNPESGTINYQYDSNGNLISKTDARGVVATYAYDALNRNTSVTYTNDPANTPAVTRTYDGATNGLGRLWKTETASSSRTTIDSFDALGRPLIQRQQFYADGAWSAAFQTSAVYDPAGHVKSMTYPSDHLVNYNFDSAGRLSDNAQGLAFTGNLGDGTNRTYSTGILYDNSRRWTREQFGTDMLIYNKRHYNIRGQLYDMRASTVNDDSNWNRGAIVNYYSFVNFFAVGSTGPDDNGNLLVQQHWIPTDDQMSGYTVHQQNYDYDKLNRLTWAAEYLNAAQNTGGQSYSYDRYGNRSISAWGDITSQQFTVDTATNRLGVPGGQSGTMAYDNAGNLTYDSYTGDGPRNYDAENRMKQAWWSYGGWQTYTYDGNGKRTRRNINGSETWQVYGIGGELLAEYSANATPTNPQKEYGYRNGELLITAAGSSCGVGNTGSQTWVGTDGHLGHVTGHAEGTNWAVYGGSDSPTAMVYGPYDTTYGQGHHTAQFKLMVDNNSGSDVVGSLDVVTGYGGNVLATRQVRRSDFTAANQWQTFTLQFDNPCFGYFEARVWWAGNASMKFAQLTITSLEVASSGVQWLVTDQLGTPRMVFDKTGSLGGVSRHDYMPFGEELYVGTGGRTSTEGYNTDNVRQHFTGYEADGETGLNFAQARYQSPVQGRFTSVDPLGRSANVLNPQSFNRYSYVLNSPTNLTDPFGLMTKGDQADPETGDDGKGEGDDPQEDPPGDPFEGGSQIRLAAEARYNSTAAGGMGSPWPAETHDAIIADALPGLTPEDLAAVQNGSREVDVGVGYLTILPEQAYLHAMVPSSWVDKFGLEKATQMAKDAAAKFTEDKLAEARKFMAKAARSPFKDEAAGLRKIAFAAFGMAMHPIMDAQSPMHKWQVYYLTGMPGVDVGFAVMHARGESRNPTSGEMSIMRDQIRMYFCSTFSTAEYQKAITPRR